MLANLAPEETKQASADTGCWRHSGSGCGRWTGLLGPRDRAREASTHPTNTGPKAECTRRSLRRERHKRGGRHVRNARVRASARRGRDRSAHQRRLERRHRTRRDGLLRGAAFLGYGRGLRRERSICEKKKTKNLKVYKYRNQVKDNRELTD